MRKEYKAKKISLKDLIKRTTTTGEELENYVKALKSEQSEFSQSLVGLMTQTNRELEKMQALQGKVSAVEKDLYEDYENQIRQITLEKEKLISEAKESKEQVDRIIAQVTEKLSKIDKEIENKVKELLPDLEKIYATIPRDLKGLDPAKINAGLLQLDRLIRGEIKTKTAEELDKEIDDITDKLGPLDKKIKLLMMGISAVIHDRLGH